VLHFFGAKLCKIYCGPSCEPIADGEESNAMITTISALLRISPGGHSGQSGIPRRSLIRYFALRNSLHEIVNQIPQSLPRDIKMSFRVVTCDMKPHGIHLPKVKT
jgi:hypothetical protein